MQKVSLSRKLSDTDEVNSDLSGESQSSISSSEENLSDSWESSYSTDTEQLEATIEKEVVSSPILTGGRVMKTGSVEEEMVAGPNSALPVTSVTP